MKNSKSIAKLTQRKKTMSYLNKNTQAENLEYILKHLDEDGRISDEFLAEFAGVNKADFNRRADQLLEEGYPLIFQKKVTAECISHKHPNPKIIRIYEIDDAINILSQYKNKDQIKAIILCKLALRVVFSKQKKTKSLRRKSTIPVPVYNMTVFGKLEMTGTVLRNIDELTKQEHQEAVSLHITKIIGGLGKKQEKITKSLFEINHSKMNPCEKVKNEVLSLVEQISACFQTNKFNPEKEGFVA